MLLSVKNIVGNAKHMKSVMEPTRQHLIILVEIDKKEKKV